MRVTGTAAAARIVERAKRDRRGALVFTIGTGCCESTAPFLYEDGKWTVNIYQAGDRRMTVLATCSFTVN